MEIIFLTFVDMAACLRQGGKYIQSKQMRCPFPADVDTCSPIADG
jgi:hypothetical protein